MSKDFVVFLLLAFTLCYGKLHLKNMAEFRDVGPKDLGINQTTTNKVDITSLLPENCSFPREQWIVYTGAAMALPNENKSYFGYIFYGAQAAMGVEADLGKFPVMIWMNGGPGSSSQLGNFEEMGPLLVYGRGEVQSKYTFVCNKYTWNVNYSMLFIDNPIGTGLSYAETSMNIPTNQDQVASQLYYGLTELYKNGVLKNLTKADLFIFGESYAGKYVPAIAQKILQMNGTEGAININLKGIGVGDGFTDPKTIMSTLGVFAFNLGYLDVQERAQEESYILRGNQRILNQQWIQARSSFDDVMDYIADRSGMTDPYNFQHQIEPRLLDLTQFLNSTWVKAIFEFPPNLNYAQSSSDVYNALGEDFMKSDCVQRLEWILNHNSSLPVLYYNGQNDIIVCTPCTEMWLDQVVYSGNTIGTRAFYNMQFDVWNATINGVWQVAGYNKSSVNLDFYTVNKAGHLVPTDQPEAALQMVTNWINKVLG